MHFARGSASMNMTVKGVIAAVLSNILFALLFFYGTILAPMNGTDIFAWRMITMLPVFILLLSIQKGGLKRAYSYLERLKRKNKYWYLIFAIPTPILAWQLWIFMWGPLNGYGISISVGYFIFPLALMAGGMMIFKERLDKIQWIAVALAFFGVALEVILSGTFSWVVFIIFSTYPIYFLIRRYYGVPALVGLTIDLLIIAPFALIYVLFFSESLAMILNNPWLILGIILLGLNAGFAMQLNMLSNEWLPVYMFSILGYVEPALLFLIAVLFLHEPISWNALISYSFIWIGIVIMLWHSLKHPQQSHLH